MTLQRLLKERLAARNPSEVAKQLGYGSNYRKALVRIDSIISSPDLGLDTGGFDLRHSTEELLRKLSEILSIPSLFCDKVIEETQAALLLKRNRFKRYVFIETNFKRKSEPVFMLSFLQARRFIKVDERVYNVPINEQVALIQEQVKAHYLKQPIIELWGAVSQYVYFHSDDLVLVFSTEGELLGDAAGYSYSRAALHI